MYVTALCERPKSLFGEFDCKPVSDHLMMHYCPGCGHGLVHKYLANAIDALGMQHRTVAIVARSAAPSSLTTTSTSTTSQARARPRAGGGARPEAGAAGLASSSATRETATSRRSASPRSCRPPTAASPSPSSS